MPRYFEITGISKGGKTGKRLGVVRASSRREAVDTLSQRKNLPSNVRVFSARLKKSKNPKKQLTVYDSWFKF